MSNLAEGSVWKTEKLSDLPIQFIDGDRSAKYPKREEFQDEGVLFLNTTNIVGNRFDFSEANFISQEKFEQIKKGRCQPLDIVMTTRGSVGKVALFHNIEYSKALVNAQMLIIRADGLELDHKFLYYILSSTEFQKKLKNFSSGAAQPQIPIRDLREIYISYSPLETQRKIASILSAYDDLIENNTQRIKILEEMAQAIYREWFVNFRFPGHEKVKMVDSPLGRVPEGWEVKGLLDLAVVKYGKNLPTKNLVGNGLYPVYGAAKVIGYFSEFTREKRTIICGCRGSVGEMQITKPLCYVTNNSFTFDPKHPYLFFWFYLSLKLRGLKDVIGGAAQPQITLEGISSVDLLLPPSTLCTSFQQTVSEMYQLLWALSQKSENLRQTRDLLLPKLISGEVDVAEFDINLGAA